MRTQGDDMVRRRAPRPRTWTSTALRRDRRVIVMRRLTLVAAAALACTAAWGGPTAHGTRSAADDQRARQAGQHIVWSQFVDLDFSGARIMVSDPQGRNAHRLTHPPAGFVDIDPKISPNGRLVAFERDDTDGNAHPVIVGTDGRGLHEVDVRCVDPCLSSNGPTWTPDGRHLIFEKVVGPIDAHGNASSARVWKTDLSGDHAKRLSPKRFDGVFEDADAQFAPSGYMVVVRLSLARNRPALFRMRPDMSHACRLTPWALSSDLMDVSPATHGPTKDLVVFETYGHNQPPPGTTSAVATVRARCHGDHPIRYVTSPHSGSIWHFNPGWSPDGRHLVFVRFKSVNGDPVVHGDLVTSRWDGTDRHRIVNGPLFDFRPDWGRAP